MTLRQLKSTMDQLDRIFKVPETVEELEQELDVEEPELLKIHNEYRLED